LVTVKCRKDLTEFELLLLNEVFVGRLTLIRMPLLEYRFKIDENFDVEFFY